MYATRLTSTSGSTPTEDIRTVVRAARQQFEGGQTLGMTWRLRQLEGITRLLDERAEAAVQAVSDDTGRPPGEALDQELSAARRVAEHARRSLAAWMRGERRSAPLLLQPSFARVHREPNGVVLVVTPWCEPLRLPLTALVGAVAGGNAVILKPSELAPATSAFLAHQLPSYLDPEAVAVVEGGAAEAEALLAEPIDHLFFSGQRETARSVMRAAAEQLVPVTLAVGGKNPCFVDRSADLAVAARRIVWGKYLACGQTCLAPDYVLVHEAVEEALVARIAEAMLERFGEDPKSSSDYGRLASVHHITRLERLLRGRGRVVIGGVIDRRSARASLPRCERPKPPRPPRGQGHNRARGRFGRRR
ncbi:MAG: aldehyde dehydrogenase family protein, partial [Myxococcota bacterium]